MNLIIDINEPKAVKSPHRGLICLLLRSGVPKGEIKTYLEGTFFMPYHYSFIDYCVENVELENSIRDIPVDVQNSYFMEIRAARDGFGSENVSMAIEGMLASGKFTFSECATTISGQFPVDVNEYKRQIELLYDFSLSPMEWSIYMRVLKACDASAYDRLSLIRSCKKEDILIRYGLLEASSKEISSIVVSDKLKSYLALDLSKEDPEKVLRKKNSAARFLMDSASTQQVGIQSLAALGDFIKAAFSNKVTVAEDIPHVGDEGYKHEDMALSGTDERLITGR